MGIARSNSTTSLASVLQRFRTSASQTPLPFLVCSIPGLAAAGRHLARLDTRSPEASSLPCAGKPRSASGLDSDTAIVGKLPLVQPPALHRGRPARVPQLVAVAAAQAGVRYSLETTQRAFLCDWRRHHGLKHRQ